MMKTMTTTNPDKCLHCKHCISEPFGGKGLVCDALAPIVYVTLDTPGNRACLARECTHYVKR